MKNSGLGRRQGREGIHRFVEVQSIGTQSALPIAPSHGVGGKSFTSAMTGVMRVLKRSGRA
jgi:succinate-semialdehyde dehydrogenase/glutarate-semialdehyde dehydrogenase